MNDTIKVRMVRGICLNKGKNQAYKAGAELTISSTTKNPNEQEILRLAKPGVLHMGRKVAEFVLDGPDFSLTAEQLEVFKLAPKSVYPEIAENLAKQLECSVEHAAAVLAQALNVPSEAFLSGPPPWERSEADAMPESVEEVSAPERVPIPVQTIRRHRHSSCGHQSRSNGS